MRDVSAKVTTLRTAHARAVVTVSPGSILAIREGRVPKGDPLPVAKVAAVMAVKNAPQLIPYCHPLPVEHVDVSFELAESQITVDVRVKTIYKTGVEMEALAGAAAAALNLYDILKMIDDDLEISSIRLLEKTGGKSNYERLEGWTFGIVVVSDSVSAGKFEDKSGKALESGLAAHGGRSCAMDVVPDEGDAIQASVSALAGQGLDFVFLTGGTGLGPRDVTPEAVSPLLERRLPGVEEQLRGYGQDRTPTAMLSRSVAGIVGQTVVVALPGSTSAVNDAVDALFPHLLHARHILRGGGH
ncbi:MAG: bifunctional molybdenum cofactor biosynthesis protein MoaC/MoaB [Armatimonadetes bacterium]|nr:bifunctional molybdenum cofactor biosynthesis protein MoaC/MoaB [Armatimonadota bacterium]